MKYTDFYYDIYIGERPDNEEYYDITNKVFEYLSSATNNSNIQKMFENGYFPSKDFLTFKDIPEQLYENSLLKKDTFYFHKELEILSKSPIWDTKTNTINNFDFYQEMKITYTIDDLYLYFINHININKEWIDKKATIGSIKYLLENFKKFDFIEPIDFLLHLIDYCNNEEFVIDNLLDVKKYEISFAKIFEPIIIKAKKNNKNIITFRS